MLFSYFTLVIACIDEGDEERLKQLLEALECEDVEVIDFPGSGKLHNGWGTTVLEPDRLYGWQRPGGSGDSPEEQIMRMEACIQVGHVFLGTCEAFRGLLLTEIHEQVDGYVTERIAGRPPEELNRIRTLALAAVNLTDFGRVTPSAADLAYFQGFNAELNRSQRSIQQSSEVLYSVQAAETQAEESKRQRALNIIALVLASLTLMSVSALGYDFIRADEPLIQEQSERLRLLVEFALGVIVVALALILATRPRARRRRRNRSANH